VNYNKSLEDKHLSYLSVGFTGGYVQRSVDMNLMTLDNQYVNGSYNAGNPTGETLNFTKITHFDLGAGVSFNSSMGPTGKINYYIGGAVFHVTKPKESFNENESFIRLTTKYSGNLGVRWRINQQFGLTVHANYLNQRPYQEIIFGGLLSWKPMVSSVEASNNKFSIYAGAFLRVKDAVIPTIKIDYKTYSFTASYDVTTSSLKPSVSSKGGWEFSIYARGVGKKKLDQNKCPRFEGDFDQNYENQ